MSLTPDWQLLHATAIAASKKAYAPYSNFPVGVAGLVSDDDELLVAVTSRMLVMDLGYALNAA